MAGYLISLEGIDGSGKSTQLLRLERVLKAADLDVVVAREPGSSPMGEAVREILLNEEFDNCERAEIFLFLAARAQITADLIRPALEAGKIVLMDRFVHSTIAYQGYGRGLDAKELDHLCRVATGGIWPDMTLYLDVPVQVASLRLQARNASKSAQTEDTFERLGTDFMDRVAGGYDAIAVVYDEVVRIDASQSEAVIHSDIALTVQTLINTRRVAVPT